MPAYELYLLKENLKIREVETQAQIAHPEDGSKVSEHTLSVCPELVPPPAL